MQHLGRSERNREHGDIVLLAELLRRASDRFSGLGGYRGGALEAEELAPLILRFDDTVGDEQHGLAVVQAKAEGGKRDVRQSRGRAPSSATSLPSM